MYADDNDQRLPQDSYRWQGRDIGWEEAVFPYVKDWRMYRCGWQTEGSVHPLRPDGIPLPSFFGYGPNRAYLFPPQTVALTDVKQPAATIMLADRDMLGRDLRAPIAGHGAAMDPCCNVALRHDERGTPPGQGNPRKDGANFVFADGHVKYMKAGGPWSKDDSLWDLK
jgi:prepilin-type processing-associated H-X9-DG protein